jgi:hypothetical protein
MVLNCVIDLFTKISTLHNRETRQAEFNLSLPRPNTNFCKKLFSYRGAVLTGNDLLPNIKNLGSLSTFKMVLVTNNGKLIILAGKYKVRRTGISAFNVPTPI